MAIHLNLPPNSELLDNDLARFGIPEVVSLAARNQSKAVDGNPMHRHEGMIEVIHILKGERVYRVEDKSYRVRGNQVFVTWPNELHGSGRFVQESGRFLHGRGLHLVLRGSLPRPGKKFLDFEAKRARPLLEALWNMPNRHFSAAPELRDLFARMLHLCRSGPSALVNMELSIILAEWFLTLTKCAATAVKEDITPDIRRALKAMHAARNGALATSDLAEAACLSESRFIGKFREQLGMPPGEYQLRLRTEQAAEMLRAGNANMTDVAYETGFSSSQHFSVTFKKFFGQSPLSWMREQCGEQTPRQKRNTRK